MMNALSYGNINSWRPVATFIFGIILNFVMAALHFARAQIVTIATQTLVYSRQKIVHIVRRATEKQINLVSNHTRWVLGLLLPVAALPAQSADGSWKSILFEADKLYNDHSYKKLRELLLQYKDDGKAEILWRLARATYEVAKLSSSSLEQKRLDYEAYDYIEKALEIDPNNFSVHKWMFILLDKKSSYEGIKERISQSFNVKKHIERACELNPKDGTSLHLLGYWCFSVAELPWFQRQIASTLFASPPVSSYQEALQYFLRAEEVEPNFYSKNLLMIGKTYMRLKDKEKAVVYLTRARDYPVGSAEDVEAKEEAISLLKSL